jgi:hypothetical protein
VSRDDGLGEWCTHTHLVSHPEVCCVHPAAVQAVIDAARAFADEIDTVGLGKTWQLVYDAVRALDGGAE